MEASQGSDDSGHEGAVASLFLRVLSEVPELQSCVSVATTASLCWPALLAVLQCRTASTSPAGKRSCCALCAERVVGVPVLRVDPRGALLAGLARRVEPDARFVGRLKYAGARFAVGSARALHAAADRLGDFDASSEPLGVLRAMLEADAGSEAEIELVDLKAPVMDWDATDSQVSEAQGVIAEILRSPQSIRHLRHLSLDEMAHFAALCEVGLRYLERVHLSAALTPAEVADLAAARPDRLTALRMRTEDNALDQEVGRSLAALITSCSTLSKLSITGNEDAGHGSEAAVLVFDALASHDTRWQKMIHLVECGIGDVGAEAAGWMLARTSTIACLDLVHNIIGDAGAQGLARGLAGSSSLSHLSLSDTSIETAGLAALASAIAVNKSVRTLKLFAGEADDSAVDAIESMLRDNATLGDLHFRADMTARGWGALFAGLACNEALRGLSLAPESRSGPGGWNEFGPCSPRPGDSGVAGLTSALRTNRHLEYLNLKSCKIGSRGAESIAEGLRFNQGLRELVLRKNDLQASGGRMLAFALQDNKVLRKLDIGLCKVGADAVRTIGECAAGRPETLLLGLAETPGGHRLFDSPPGGSVCFFCSCEGYETAALRMDSDQSVSMGFESSDVDSVEEFFFGG